MPTDEYITLAAFEAELEKIAKAQSKEKPSSLAQDFAGGVDPFGTWTSGFGQRNERAGISEREHRKKRVVGAVGGAVGGAALLPATITGIAAASKVVRRGPRAMAKAFRKGAKMPFQRLHRAHVSGRAMKRIQKKGGGTLSPRESKAVRKTVGRASISDAAAQLLRTAKENPKEALQQSPDQVKQLAERLVKGKGKLYVSKGEAKHLGTPIRREVSAGGVQLGLGGAVGAVGADVQYRKGRAAEKEFRKREGKG